jgi:tetratricopeptide (TPR) repeat protein
MTRSRGHPFTFAALAIAALIGASLFGVLCRPARSAPAAGLTETFARGNSLYEGGDYEGAIEQYSSLVAKGVTRADLYYNLANSYYKTGDLGRTALYYERARRVAPRDGDVRENLALVRAQLRDKQFVREENRLLSGLAWLHNHLNAGEMRLAASLCYAALCLLGIVFVLRETRWVSAGYRVLSYGSLGRLAGLSKTQDLAAAMAVAALLFLSTGISAYQKTRSEKVRQTAVVLSEEVAVMSGPTDDATLQFKIHQGTLVSVNDQRGAWMRIALPGGLSGWVSVSSIERV